MNLRWIHLFLLIFILFFYLNLRPVHGLSINYFPEEIYFSAGSAEFNEKTKKDLDTISKRIKNLFEKGEMQCVNVLGYTDPVEAKDPNGLSKLRADRVREYFIKKGIPADKLIIRYFGDTRPFSSNKTEADKAKNRKVDFDSGIFDFECKKKPKS